MLNGGKTCGARGRMASNRVTKGHGQADHTPPSSLGHGGTSIEYSIHSVGHSYTSSHSRAVASALPDATISPSGLKHAE